MLIFWLIIHSFKMPHNNRKFLYLARQEFIPHLSQNVCSQLFENNVIQYNAKMLTLNLISEYSLH